MARLPRHGLRRGLLLRLDQAADPAPCVSATLREPSFLKRLSFHQLGPYKSSQLPSLLEYVILFCSTQASLRYYVGKLEWFQGQNI